jgi:hypothetical protein
MSLEPRKIGWKVHSRGGTLKSQHRTCDVNELKINCHNVQYFSCVYDQHGDMKKHVIYDYFNFNGRNTFS